MTHGVHGHSPKVPGFEAGTQVYNINHKENTTELTMYDETYPNGKKPAWFGKLKIKFILNSIVCFVRLVVLQML